MNTGREVGTEDQLILCTLELKGWGVGGSHLVCADESAGLSLRVTCLSTWQVWERIAKRQKRAVKTIKALECKKDARAGGMLVSKRKEEK